MNSKEKTINNLQILRDHWAKLSFDPYMSIWGGINGKSMD